MRYGTRPSRRTGFTLIELLVVMGILALLSALTVAGIASVRSAQMNKVTGQTVTKLQKALDQQVRAVGEEASNDRNPHLQAVLGFCDGDRDRAKALLTYLYQKREFPQTFAEATSPVVIPGVLTLPARKTFAIVATYGAVASPAEQSAVLLYLILTEKSSRGAGIAMDDVTSSAQTTIPGSTGQEYFAFKDAYGLPIAFARWFQSTELNSAPYVNPNAKASLFDPNDRLSINQQFAKLRDWNKPFPGNTPNPVNQGIAAAALNANGGPAVAFDGKNKVITVVAAGPNKTLELSPTAGDDDVYGYRLARFGNQGN